jgi:predicted transcriptional regulator of viral defense system
MNQSKMEQAIRLVKRLGVLRPRDLDRYGIPRVYLQRLCERGEVLRLSRGLYASAELELTENHSLAEACKRVPHGIVCLLSALRFHELTTQLPREVWMALDVSSQLPKGHGLPLRFVRFSGRALSEGVETYRIEGVTIRVTTPAKTVVDCFKYRNKIGLDVAMEALRDAWRQKKATMAELDYFGKICRVSKVMRPYLESLI